MHRARLVTQLALVAIAAATLLGSAWAQNLVYNGSFEEPAHNEQWVTYNAGSTFGGWRVTKGTIDLHRHDAPMDEGPAFDGYQFVDLNGNSMGGIAQSINIPTAGLYRLLFAMSANTSHNPLPPRTMRVDFGNLYSGSFVFDPQTHPGHTYRSYQWDLHTVDILVPHAGTYALSFTSTFTLNYFSGPTVDFVSLTLVPEPASFVVLGSVLASLLALRRRKQ